MAEAYLKSLELDGVTIRSSGTLAASTQTEEQLIDPLARNILEREGILDYASPHWNQLTRQRLEQHKGITILFGSLCVREAVEIGVIPPGERTWDITDVSEYENNLGHNLEEADRLAHADLVYKQIVSKIDKLVGEQ